MKSKTASTIAIILVLAVVVMVAPPVLGQLVTADVATGGLTPDDLVDVLLGAESAAEVSNVSLVGDSRCAGVFMGGGPIIGPDTGVLLASGEISNAPGPNSSDAQTTAFFTPGDAFLDTLVSPFTTHDACVLEFDFECPTTDVVSFEYVFGSDEYNEFVNSQYNDAFAFALNGTNIALLPDNVTPVTINTVNSLTNPAFYVDNDCDDTPCAIDIEADGLTVQLGAQSGLNAGVNNIRLAIADTGDSALDSWAFIEGGSFQCAPLCDEAEPIAWWQFDETEEEAGPSGSTVLDTTENDNDGKLHNDAPRTPGLVGTAATLDGISHFVRVGSKPILDNLEAFTYSAWIYPTATGDREIFSKNNSTRELRLEGSGTLRGCIIAFGGNACSDSVATVPLGTWTHVAMTYDHAGDKLVHLYIDGAEVAYSAQSMGGGGSMQNDAQHFQQLGRRQNNTRAFEGKLDEMMIFDQVLPDCRIEALAVPPV